MTFSKLILTGILIAVAFFDFSPGLNHNSWATEPIGDSLVAYDNYLLIRQAIADNAIIPEYTPCGFDLYIINGIVIFFLGCGLIIRSFYPEKISTPILATYFLMFLVSFCYAMATEWSCLKVPPWIFLLSMIGLVFFNSEYCVRRVLSNHP